MSGLSPTPPIRNQTPRGFWGLKKKIYRPFLINEKRQTLPRYFNAAVDQNAPIAPKGYENKSLYRVKSDPSRYYFHSGNSTGALYWDTVFIQQLLLVYISPTLLTISMTTRSDGVLRLCLRGLKFFFNLFLNFFLKKCFDNNLFKFTC